MSLTTRWSTIEGTAGTGESEKFETIETAYCSDWHRGWGYGGHDKIGTLCLLESATGKRKYLWDGHRQGRHGSRSGSYRLMFTQEDLDSDSLPSGLPTKTDILKAIKELTAPPAVGDWIMIDGKRRKILEAYREAGHNLFITTQGTGLASEIHRNPSYQAGSSVKWEYDDEIIPLD